ncbi:hypothetical protein ACIHEJ_39630 [Streptomyces sp. NPDC052301]|uniref:hypothetical protein n=1 Tax=Streptomyces sp. NPDC052301 TaxID=3365687 RepID=UPI0037CED744
MYQFEIHEMRSAELRRVAQRERLAREVARSRRAARRTASAGADIPAAESHIDRPRRNRLPRTA